MTPDRQQATALLVDDDPVFTRLAAKTLKLVDAKVLIYHSADEFLSDWQLADINPFRFKSHVQDTAAALRIPDWPAPFSRHGCLILDLVMPGITGMELRRQIVQENVYLPTVFVSASASADDGAAAVQCGALKLLEKPTSELIHWVETAIEHDRLYRKAYAERKTLLTRLNTLSPRESEVLAGLLLGKSPRQLADEFQSKPATVRRQRMVVFEKLRVPSNVALRSLIEELRSPVPAANEATSPRTLAKKFS